MIEVNIIQRVPGVLISVTFVLVPEEDYSLFQRFTGLVLDLGMFPFHPPQV